MTDGLFLTFCEDARRDPDGTHVLVVDEINRADLNAVMGELLLLLEYRGRVAALPYSRRPFSVPDNVVLLGTLNTADRSLALLDFALRRRFHAISLEPSAAVLQRWLADRGEDTDLVLRFFELVSDRVGDWESAPGHSYWMADDLSAQGLARVWRYELRPYLAEYWAQRRGQLDSLDREVALLLGDEG